MADIDDFNAHSERLVFVFDSKEAANHFKVWLTEEGEQTYWGWMEYREAEDDGPITGLDFDYHSGTDGLVQKPAWRRAFFLARAETRKKSAFPSPTSALPTRPSTGACSAQTPPPARASVTVRS